MFNITGIAVQLQQELVFNFAGIGVQLQQEYAVSSFNTIETKLAYKLGAKFSQKGVSSETIASVFIQQLGQNCPSTKLGLKWQSDGFE